jgi:hypothetical protein
VAQKKQYRAPQLQRRERLAEVVESTEPVVTDGQPAPQ